MSYFRPFMQEHREIMGELQDIGSVRLPPAPECEEDWSDLRWGLEHLPQEKERDRILRTLLAAEIEAEMYLDDHGAPERPEPEWLNWEDDDA
jgi:hypothetical protein